ncbi:hypothetical protein [Clostridium sp. C8]|uniref:hypothetical protein n=1 Tax=Clostridium sp. C8 TaxID=1667357 RepID=UPI00062E41C6|nr:hypothetical protein [Clostridium sp. C8]KLE14146.1 hypothetical protein AAT22_18275 [Clostridium sp. C8]
MDREDFLKLSLIEQVDFFNSKMKSGYSMTKIANELGISKSISEKFKKNGYKLIENQFIKSNPIEKQTKENRAVREIGRGRPSRTDDNSKHTVIMNDEVWQELQIYAIRNKTTVSRLLENLAKEFLNL